MNPCSLSSKTREWVIEFYPQIKLVHIVLVLISGSIFSLRGLLMLAGSAHSGHPLLKWTSYINDSLLLTAGLLLMTITQQYPGAQAWLSVKLGLLVVYIVLGVFALRRGRTRRSRGMFFFAALGVYVLMISIAISHQPMGLLHALRWT